MKLFTDIEQGSDEWKVLRSRYFTASAVGDWLVELPEFRKTKKEIRELLESKNLPCPADKEKLEVFEEAVPFEDYLAAMSYTERRNTAWNGAIYKRLGAISMDDEPEKETWEMRRGKELEQDARVAYEIFSGNPTIKAAFCAHDSDEFGNSPDSLVLKPDCRDWEIKTGPYDSSIFQNGTELKCHVARVHSKFLLEGGFEDEHKLQCHVSMAATEIQEWHLFGYHPELPPLFHVFKWDDFTELVRDKLLALSDDYMEAKCRLQEMWRKSNHPQPAA